MTWLSWLIPIKGSTFLQCDYYNLGHLDKVDISDYRKITIHSKKVGCRPTSNPLKNKKLLEAHNLNIGSKRVPRKQNISADNVFLFETLHITLGDIFVLFDTPCFVFICKQFLPFHCCALQ